MNTTRRMFFGGRLLTIAIIGITFAPVTAQAVLFDIPIGDGIQGNWNTSITGGAAWRMQDRSSDLVGKSNLNPEVCGRTADNDPRYEVCVGLFREQSFKAEHLVSQPGAFSLNLDDGNLNYDKHDAIATPIKVNSDLLLKYGDFGFFARILYFNDPLNNSFNEFHPNRITPENFLDVGYVDTMRSDSRACPADRTPPDGVAQCSIVYGPGGVVRNRRTDREILRQIGEDFQVLDLNIYGKLPLFGDRELNFKIGNQLVNWGESTALVINSLSQANPLNVNNFYRFGSTLDEVFTPTGMALFSTDITYDLGISAFYGYEWEPTEIPAPGSFFSFVDLGTNNTVDSVVLGFGGNAEDPEGLGRLGDNPLAAITNTTGRGTRLPDNEARDGGQWGVSLSYYAPNLNTGTEFGFYAMNYHSKLPYVSTFAVQEACSKNSTSTAEFFADCPDIPATHMPMNDPDGATDSALHFDQLALMLEYPEDLKMYGMSFNTAFGDVAIQGEVSYRPDSPLQVHVTDLAFAAFGPTLNNCHLPETGCTGSGIIPPNTGLDENGNTIVYGSSDYVVDANDTPGDFPDTYDLLTGTLPGSGRAFPSFIVPYRGGTLGLNPPRDLNAPLDRNNPGYIQGWENFDVWQGLIGGTYVSGPKNWIGADQIIWLFEVGWQYVPDLPPLDILQIEAPGQFLHASAGADGRNSDRSRQACSTLVACSFGADGVRFNPTQADLSAFPDKFSWGYALITQVRYLSVLPGISIAPLLIFQHDVKGTSTDVAAQFTEGRMDIQLINEITLPNNLSVNVGYTWFTGGGLSNLQKDRDYAQLFARWRF